MTIKIGINGFGRIGRNVLRALYESDKRSKMEIVAINDLGDAKTNAHLTRRDTSHGQFPGQIEVEDDAMIVNGDRIKVLAERDPSNLPWGELGVEIVFVNLEKVTLAEKDLNGNLEIFQKVMITNIFILIWDTI